MWMHVEELRPKKAIHEPQGIYVHFATQATDNPPGKTQVPFERYISSDLSTVPVIIWKILILD